MIEKVGYNDVLTIVKKMKRESSFKKDVKIELKKIMILINTLQKNSLCYITMLVENLSYLELGK